MDEGSVALDGVSLTVRAPQGRRFSVALIRETLGATTLGERKVGDRVNFEADLLAKQIERLMEGKVEGAERGGYAGLVGRSGVDDGGV